MVASRRSRSAIGALLGETTTEIDVARKNRVFCNRNLRMDSIEMIGFDMDYTLALYHQDKLEQLSIELTLGKLIEKHGYPEEIRSLALRPALGDPRPDGRPPARQRVQDGPARLRRALLPRLPRARSTTQRRPTYRNEKINLSSDRFEWIDTLFGLPEAVMYTTLVDWADRTTGTVDYDKLFGDIRTAIDEAHRDDTLKSVIKADLAGVHRQGSAARRDAPQAPQLGQEAVPADQLALRLHRRRDELPARRRAQGVPVVAQLLRHRDRRRRQAGLLQRAASVRADRSGDRTRRSRRNGEIKHLSRDKVYQGGNVVAFEQMTGIKGEQVLYIGDHIYGDILRLRKQHMWRTAMVLQELEREISVSERLEAQIQDLDLLDRRHRNLESEIDYQTLRLKKIQRLLDDPDRRRRCARGSRRSASCTRAASTPARSRRA